GGTAGHRWVALLGGTDGCTAGHRWAELVGTDHQGTDHQSLNDRCRSLL
ncbi:unnamed protein product, partial [Staurois parvus]